MLISQIRCSHCEQYCIESIEGNLLLQYNIKQLSLIIYFNMQSPTKSKYSFKSKYEIIQKIGAGKMGVIYKVKKLNDESGVVFAAKFISLNDIDIETAKKQMKILQSLKHMYILHYYEQFFDQTQLIIITEYCGGKDLAYHIKRMKENKKYFNENLVSTWIFQLIMAIDYIHSMSIAHRDLKPQNIFVDHDMNLKIGDFGVSKLLDGTQHCKTMVGSPLYLSPELLNDAPYTKKTDIWSLGCVIFEICSLQAPFKTKKGFYDLYNVIKTEQPKNIPSLYSSDLNKLIKLMLIKDPKKRPSAQQLYQHPILVNLLINYSSNVNLQEQYENKAIQRPELTDSYIDVQNKMINDRLKSFQQQIKEKMESFKNKKVKKDDIQKNYEEIQKKMKELEKVMKAAFDEMKNKGEGELNEVEKMKSTIKNSSRLSESDETIMSVDLDNGRSRLNPTNLADSSSIDSVNSIMIQSKKPNNFGISQLDQSIKQKSTKIQNQDDLDVTLKSEYTETIRQSSNAGQMKELTVSRLDTLSKEIINDPSLLLDETFLSCTLSLSNNNDLFGLSRTNNAHKKKKPAHDVSQSEQSLNFDFSKKSYDESLGKLKIKEKEQKQKEQQDSLEEYEADFESFEEDQEMDMRAVQRESVKNLFATTLKNMGINNDSNTSQKNPNLKSRYALSSLSQIKQLSSCAEGSVISRNQSFD